MPPRYGFTLANVAPKDPRFRAAPETVREALWVYLGQEGLDLWRQSREQNLDRHGQTMHPLALSTIAKGRWRSHTGRGDPHGPALDPAHGESRTESLLRVKAFPDRAEYSWAIDDVTGLPWGKVLWWHATGAGRLPIRDVLGFSAEEQLELARRGQLWWTAYLHGGLVAAAALRARLPLEPLAKLKIHLAAPAPFAPTGRVDFEHYTFGIGGTEAGVRRAITEGYFTGFSKATKPPPLLPRGGQPKPQPARPTPAARPPGRVAASPTAGVQVKPAAVAPTVTFEPVTPERAAAFDLPRFAAAAKEAAKAAEHPIYGGKAFIHEAFQVLRQQPEYFGMSLGQFKRHLIESQTARHLDLSRADLVEAMREIDVETSHTEFNKATFNFIRF